MPALDRAPTSPATSAVDPGPDETRHVAGGVGIGDEVDHELRASPAEHEGSTVIISPSLDLQPGLQPHGHDVGLPLPVIDDEHAMVGDDDDRRRAEETAHGRDLHPFTGPQRRHRNQARRPTRGAGIIAQTGQRRAYPVRIGEPRTDRCIGHGRRR